MKDIQETNNEVDWEQEYDDLVEIIRSYKPENKWRTMKQFIESLLLTTRNTALREAVEKIEGLKYGHQHPGKGCMSLICREEQDHDRTLNDARFAIEALISK